MTNKATAKVYSLTDWRETVAFRKEMADFAREGLLYNMREIGTNQAMRAFCAARPHFKSDPELAKGIITFVYRKLRVWVRPVLKRKEIYPQEVREEAFTLACTTFASVLNSLIETLLSENPELAAAIRDRKVRS